MRKITPKRLRGLLSSLYMLHPREHHAACLIVAGRYSLHDIYHVWSCGKYYWKSQHDLSGTLALALRSHKLKIKHLQDAAEDPELRAIAAASLQS